MCIHQIQIPELIRILTVRFFILIDIGCQQGIIQSMIYQQTYTR